MCLISTFSTVGKQYPDLEHVWHSDAVHKAFSAATEEQKPYLASTSSVDVPDEEKSRDKKQALLDFVKWAQEQQWKGSPDLSTNHDAYFYEAAKEDLESDDDDDDDENADGALETKI